jgi:hypothetical protein
VTETLRSVVSLASLVSAINNGGHPSLEKPSIMNDTDLECRQSGSNAVLNAAATIFVRNNEGITAALSGTHLLVMQTQGRDSSGEAPLHITSTQPPAEINVLDLPYDGRCILVDKGKSFLPSITLKGDRLWDHYCDEL